VGEEGEGEKSERMQRERREGKDRRRAGEEGKEKNGDGPYFPLLNIVRRKIGSVPIFA
jgi:hypothetical protein